MIDPILLLKYKEGNYYSHKDLSCKIFVIFVNTFVFGDQNFTIRAQELKYNVKLKLNNTDGLQE